MSQIDKLTFVPHLFWYCILFLIFYFLMFSYVLPLIFQTLKVRNFFFFSTIYATLLYNVFYFFITSLYEYDVLKCFVSSFLFFLLYYKNYFNVTGSMKAKAIDSSFKII